MYSYSYKMSCGEGSLCQLCSGRIESDNAESDTRRGQEEVLRVLQLTKDMYIYPNATYIVCTKVFLNL